MTKLIRTLRDQDTHRLVGTVFTATARMLALAQELGSVSSSPAQPEGTKAVHVVPQTEDVGAGAEPDLKALRSA